MHLSQGNSARIRKSKKALDSITGLSSAFLIPIKATKVQASHPDKVSGTPVMNC